MARHSCTAAGAARLAAEIRRGVRGGESVTEVVRQIVAAVRAGAEVVKAIGRAGPAAPTIAAHQAVRAGVARMLSGPEVER